eukprot:CAMPEP_0168316232 /NCGR_PEP_ID=MMETSP0210-20121227/14976_1 /TAXON_ID=40633 /ORGANISM="Condylostoma magnum, Strain COL2" /LENGTH=31 /DNA_ID= /DNA_START= /DNA_END= /DNA_ORIENTATION=
MEDLPESTENAPEFLDAEEKVPEFMDDAPPK